MSWFKRVRSESKNSRKSSDASSHTSEDVPEGRSRRDTDPATCLEVFRNHWEQAYQIINGKDGTASTKCTSDEVEAVIQNFEQMVTLLANEEGEEGQGMPGPILHFLLEHEILEKFCGWCHHNSDETGKLTKEQLRMFEHLISHSCQLLLIHKPVIRPLLNLLAYCVDGFNSAEIESHMILVLHQVCICISKQTVILESFFNMTTDHGPTKFLIFSLLIPFLHRRGSVGQQARDALLLIMALSSKHPYVGQYIAENSDFCPVLATGLSGLYSDLPRKIEIPSEDWYRITDEDVVKMPEMNMFLNSLEFCNAVAQISHPLVRDQLISFIYNGFLVPVLGPALHQKKTQGDSKKALGFQNSREEVITTTAYLELFLRKVSEPSLVKAFLSFILTEKNDEIVILDSLITRINSSSKLCLVSLSLFHTLVDLNCEDVMFELVFKHLIPCTHVMVSQRRSLRDVDLYSKSAEKFLSLRPTCCLPELTESPIHGLDIPCLEHPQTNNRQEARLSKFLRARRERSRNKLAHRELKPEPVKTSFPPGSFGSKLEHFETSYVEYLHDARQLLQQCALACCVWMYPYDGEAPPPSKLESEESKDSQDTTIQGLSGTKSTIEYGNQTNEDGKKDDSSSQREMDSSSKTADESSDVNSSAQKQKDDSQISTVDDHSSGEILDTTGCVQTSRIETMEDFLSMLEDNEAPAERGTNIEESIMYLDSVLSSVSTLTSRTSTPRREGNQEGGPGAHAFQSFCDTKDISSVCETEGSRQETIDEPSRKSGKDNATTFEVIGTPKAGNNATEFEILSGVDPKQTANRQNGTTFVDISVNDVKSTASKVEGSAANVHRIDRENSSLGKGDNSSKPVPVNGRPSEVGQGDSLVSDSPASEASHTASQGADEGASQRGSHLEKPLEKEEQTARSRRSSKGDKSVRFASCSMHNNSEVVYRPLSGSGLVSKSAAGPPSIGAFLTALLSKLDFMMQNSLSVNLMLTGLLARLAAYSQPLLRSFLLNHNLVFQPTVKSLVQVLTSVRQKVDHFSYTVQNFESLLLRARRTLASREGLLPERGKSLTPSPELLHTKIRSATVSEVPSKEKRHRTLSELLFRRSPAERKSSDLTPKGNSRLEMIPGKGFRYTNRRPEVKQDNQGESMKTRNAVYCALVLEEFVKELAALAQEHSVLHLHDDSCLSVDS